VSDSFRVNKWQPVSVPKSYDYAPLEHPLGVILNLDGHNRLITFNLGKRNFDGSFSLISDDKVELQGCRLKIDDLGQLIVNYSDIVY